MKRKSVPNISSSSLRSASRKNRQRKSSLKSPYSSIQEPVQNSNSKPNEMNKKSSKVIQTSLFNQKVSKSFGSCSSKSFTCLGCNNSFLLYHDESSFLKYHVESNDICPKAYPSCNGCNKLFYDEKNLISHQSRKKESSKCHKIFKQHQIMKQYASTEITIPPIISLVKPSQISNTTTYLNELNHHNNQLMYSKQITDFNQYLSQYNFMNQNIHSISSSNQFNKNFTGHAVMDPRSLSDRHTFNHTISQKPTHPIKGCIGLSFNRNKHDSISSNNQKTNHQHVDFSMSDNLLINHNIHSSDNSDSSISSSSPDSEYNGSDNDNSCFSDGKLYGQDILQKFISNDDLNEDIIVNPSDCDYNQKSITANTNHSPSNIHSTNKHHKELLEQAPKQKSINISSKYHFLKMKELQNKELANSICDNDYVESLELVQLLLKYKIQPRKIFSELMEWHNKKHSSSSNMTLTSILDKAEHRVFGKSIASKMKPISSNLICPSGRHVSVTSFDIDAIIYDLLNDDNLMQPQHLIFEDGDMNNPFDIKPQSYYSDIHTSEFYQQTLIDKKIDIKKDVLIPIQLYMDETTLDSYSHLQLHPLVMTLLIFNRKARNLSMSWRTLAYIPNFDSLFDSKSYSPEEKHDDFHYVLRYLLNGIEQIFNAVPYYKWTFKFHKYPNKLYERNITFVLGNVLGDAKGANMLCSRYGNNTFTTHIARDCDVLTMTCDDPNHKCNFHRQSHLHSLSEEDLNNLSFRKPFPYNAFDFMDFGGNIYGINGATAADPCHMFNKGVVERLPKIFMARLSPSLIKILDRHVASLVTNYGNQSYRDFPNIKIFSKGISNSSKLRSDQHIARVFVIFLVLLTPEFEKVIINRYGRKFDKDSERTKITLSEYNDWINVFEETLILHSWVYIDKHPKVFFKGGKNSIVCDRLRQYMFTYRQKAMRREGMGLKFLKFHQILHLWWIIRLFGSLYNVDTARCESHHKKKKLIGNQTQRRIELFDSQTAIGEYKYNLFIKALQHANIPLAKIFETSNNIEDIDQDNEISGSSSRTNDSNDNFIESDNESNSKCSRGSEFILTFDYENNTAKANWLSRKKKKHLPNFPVHILNAIYIKSSRDTIMVRLVKELNPLMDLLSIDLPLIEKFLLFGHVQISDQLMTGMIGLKRNGTIMVHWKDNVCYSLTLKLE